MPPRSGTYSFFILYSSFASRAKVRNLVRYVLISFSPCRRKRGGGASRTRRQVNVLQTRKKPIVNREEAPPCRAAKSPPRGLRDGLYAAFLRGNQKNLLMPSVARAWSALMVTTNLMLCCSENLSSQARNFSTSGVMSLGTILHRESMKIWEMS